MSLTPRFENPRFSFFDWYKAAEETASAAEAMNVSLCSPSPSPLFVEVGLQHCGHRERKDQTDCVWPGPDGPVDPDQLTQEVSDTGTVVFTVSSTNFTSFLGSRIFIRVTTSLDLSCVWKILLTSVLCYTPLLFNQGTFWQVAGKSIWLLYM